MAWLDLLGSDLVRGVVTRAQEAVSAPDGSDARARTTVDSRLRIPPRWPGGVLRTGVVRAYNEYRFRSTPHRATGRLEPFGAHMFPLDVLDAWPRLYGRGGLVQYQLVVPKGQERVLEQIILALRGSLVPCYLSVLKDFGPANDALMSFPMAGWTLALDLPGAAAGLAELLNGFDQLVAQAGGRVYLAKDGRLRPETLAAMYPRLAHWRAVRDRVDPEGRWLSDLGLRTGMVGRRRDLDGCHSGVLLVGGTSEIGLATVRRLRADGPVSACLLGRDRARLEAAAAGLRDAGVAPVAVQVVDADDLASHEQSVAEAFAGSGWFDVVVLAIGRLGAQAGLDADMVEAVEVMRVSFLDAGSLLLHCLRRLSDQGRGTLIVLSSVAAERPRAANAIYGAAKAGLDALAQGLADAAAGTGVRVLVVRPGFVKTKMTAGLKPAPMAVAPEDVADATVRALAGRAHTVWVPGRLRFVFAVLRHLPRSLFRKLPL